MDLIYGFSLKYATLNYKCPFFAKFDCTLIGNLNLSNNIRNQQETTTEEYFTSIAI